METVKLLIADIDLASAHHHFLLKNISSEQKEKALRYKNEQDQLRSLLSSYLVNQLSKEQLLKNDNGKPYYQNGPFFNVSHSGRYVVMAISNHEIGVDIEENIAKNMDMLLKIFNDAEVKMIKEHADFYYLWCAKESLIKCIGSSINKIKEIPRSRRDPCPSGRCPCGTRRAHVQASHTYAACSASCSPQSGRRSPAPQTA